MWRRFYKRTIIRWVLALTAFIALTIVIISSFLYTWYASDNIALYSRTTKSTLTNASSALETLDETLKSVGFLATTDYQYVSMMCSHSMNAGLDGDLRIKIANLIFNNPIIESAYLVNKRADWVVGSPSNNLIQAEPYSDAISARITYPTRYAILRVDTYEARTGAADASRPENILSYVFYQTRESGPDDSFFIINVREADFVKLLDTVDSLADSEVIVTDADGTVVLSKDPQRLYQRYGDRAFVRRALLSDELSGYFDDTDGARQSLITYVRSDALGYTFISVTPYEVVRGASIALRNRTILLSVLIFLAGLAVAFAIAAYFYSPLKKLVRKYAPAAPGSARGADEYELLGALIEQQYQKASSLDRFVSDNLPAVRQDSLRKILKGTIRLGGDTIKERLADIGIHLPFDLYRVLCLAPCEADEAEKTSAGRLALRQELCGAAGNIITSELIAPLCALEAVWEMDDETAALLLNYDEETPALRERLLDACAAIQDYARAHWNARLTIAVGDPQAGDVGPSYRSAMELMRYRLKYGDGVLLSSEKVARDIAGSGQFPEEEEKQLLLSLRNLSAEGCRECVRRIVERFYQYNIDDILHAVDHILYSTFQAAREMIQNRDKGKIDFYYTYERLVRYRTLQEMMEDLTSFYETMIRDVRNMLGRGNAGQNAVVARAIDFVRKNYMNPSISLDYVAEYVKLNPAYLGKVFKDSAGIAFPEYINRLRIDMAKELLINTNESVNRISSLVGYNSTAYFVTCFKKYVGVTPSKFK